MVVVADAMAVYCLPVGVYPSSVRSRSPERRLIQSIGLVPARDPHGRPGIQLPAEQRTLRCGSIRALASGRKIWPCVSAAASEAAQRPFPLWASAAWPCFCAGPPRNQVAKEPKLGRELVALRVCPFDAGNHRGHDWLALVRVGHMFGSAVARPGMTRSEAKKSAGGTVAANWRLFMIFFPCLNSFLPSTLHTTILLTSRYPLLFSNTYLSTHPYL
jgi:hypothetical protein